MYREEKRISRGFVGKENCLPFVSHKHQASELLSSLSSSKDIEIFFSSFEFIVFDIEKNLWYIKESGN